MYLQLELRKDINVYFESLVHLNIVNIQNLLGNLVQNIPDISLCNYSGSGSKD